MTTTPTTTRPEWWTARDDGPEVAPKASRHYQMPAEGHDDA